MVDIAQSSRPDLLIRKIGYSVGLEDTLRRMSQVTESYLDEHQLNQHQWESIVVDCFKRKKEACPHFENLFSALGFFSVENRRPIPRELLDAFALLQKYFENCSESKQKAFQAAFAFKLITADGELLLPLIANGFQKERVEVAFSNFRTQKLQLLFDYYKNPYERSRLSSTIDFKELEVSAGAKQSSNENRPPFEAERLQKRQNLDGFSVRLSNDWMRKVPTTRAGWTESLGLTRNKILTARGQDLLSECAKLNPVSSASEGSSSIFILMPTKTEMQANNLSWRLPEHMYLDPDDLSIAIIKSFSGGNGVSLSSDYDPKLVELVSWCVYNYSKADTRIAMLRRELPFLVWELFMIGVQVAENATAQPPYKVIRDVADSPKNTSIRLRPSRASGYAISVRK